MDEQKMEDRIRKSAEQIPVPEQLSPEHMKEKLDREKKVTPFSRFAGNSSVWRRRGVHAAEAAAAVLIVFAVGHRSGALDARRTMLAENTAQQMEAAQEIDAAPEAATEKQAAEVQKEASAQMDTAAQTDTAVQADESAAPEAATEKQAAAGQKEASAQMDAAAQTDTAVQADESAAPEAAAEKQAAAVQKEASAQMDTAAQAAAARHEEGFSAIGDEDALFDRLVLLKNLRNLNDVVYSSKNTMEYEYEEIAMDAVQDAAPIAQVAPEAQNGTGADAGADFSGTNLREMGVDEGDIVKTDGEYIYIMKNDSSVKIVRAEGTELELVLSLQPELLEESVQDMYVTGNMLNLITTGTRSSLVEDETDVYRTETYNYARVLTYDIADRSAPVLLGSMEQEGSYLNSRKAGDYVYLFTMFRPQIGATKEDSKIMPLINGVSMGAGDVYVPESLQNSTYLVISSVNVNDPKQAAAHKAVVSGADNFYVSAESIFIYNEEWQNSKDVTSILKFGYEDGDIWGIGAASVDGYLNNTFSLDEYQGNLRVVATDWNSGDEQNALYVFNEKMELTGKIADLAPGETIRSARFLGDIGYFVTFRQTDPLFSVDLSDPAAPKILGELKIPGFSSYLHFYGKDRLLGIGYQADEETGATTGVKLSMFDISDPANVTECKKFVIDGANYLPGASNYKAIMINPEKNIFGFVCDGNYLVFTYDEQEGFVNKLTYSLSSGDSLNSYWYAYDNVRGLFIKDTFYLTDADVIRAFEMQNGFAQSGKLEL